MSNDNIVIVSDVHGEFDALRSALSPDDTLFIAGDLINIMDFSDYSRGILINAFTMEELIEGVKEMLEGKLERIKEALREIATPGEERYQRILPLIEKSYEEFADSIVCDTYILYGNVDYPDILKENIKGKGEDGRANIIDGGTVTIDGITIGMVSGMPSGENTLGFPGEIPLDDYKKSISEIGPVDVLLAHIPPEFSTDGKAGGNLLEKPDETRLSYDTIARRNEPESPDLTEYIKKYSPSYTFFGHVHSPGVRKVKIGRTQVINLGFFRKRKMITRLNPETLEIREVEV